MSYKLKLEKHPNNETRITLYPIRRKSQALIERAAEVLGVPASEVVSVAETSPENSDRPPSLDIRSEFKTVCSAHSYKRTKFGKNAKTRLMRAGGAMDKIDPCPWHYLFLTATLPSNDEWSKWAIAEHSDWVINTLKAWLSKRLSSRLEFYVWEMQERGALHFHWCILVSDVEIRQRIIEEFRLEWTRILAGIEKRSEIPMWGRFQHLSDTAKYCIVQVKVEQIRKSVTAYMAGYCGGKKDKHSGDLYIPYYPKRWFGVSRALSSAISDLTETELEEYPSYGEALQAYEITKEYFDEDVVISKNWPHNVGVGKTSVHYHEPKKQQQLWLSRKAMQFDQQKFPHANRLCKLTDSLMRTILELTKNYPNLLKGFSKDSLGCLLDGRLRQSIRQGSYPEILLVAIEHLFRHSPLQSSSGPLVRRLLINARLICQVHSLNYRAIRWDTNRMMVLDRDLEWPIDRPSNQGYGGTTSDEAEPRGAGRANLVPSKEHTQNSAPPQQLPLFAQWDTKSSTPHQSLLH